MDVTRYLALLDQFLTKDIIGVYALAKILNVMIDSEMSQEQKVDMICSIIRIISLSFPLAFINLRGTQRQFLENICSEDDLRYRTFGAFVVKFLACPPLLGFSNPPKMI